MTRGIFFVIIFVNLLFFSVACNRDSHKGELEFYYYPEKNVYYDPVKKDFWYSVNGTKSWSTFTNSNNSEPATIGKRVVIYSATADVFKDNENHRKLYAGKLYAIGTEDTTTAIVGPEATERNAEVQKRKSTVKRRVYRKSKNSIGKFIDKIFRKRN